MKSYRESQLDTLDAIQQYITRHRRSPIISELVALRGVSKPAIQRHIERLLMNGYLSWPVRSRGRVKRGMTVTAKGRERLSAPADGGKG